MARSLGKLKKLFQRSSITNEDFFMIESIEPELSFFKQFWTQAPHPGEAIDSVLHACVRLGINNPIAVELARVNSGSVPDHVLHDEKSNVFYERGHTYFPTEKAFIAPVGIIGSSEVGKHDYEQIREGFSLTKRSFHH